MTEAAGSTAKGWSDAERIALLVSMVDAKGGPDWKNITIPPGRTQKACTHVWSKLREEAMKAEWYGANSKSPARKVTAKGDGGTPKKANAATGTKRAMSEDTDDSPAVKKRVKKVADVAPKDEPEEDE